MSTLTREHIEQALPSIKPGKILDLRDAYLIRETVGGISSESSD